MEQPWHWIDQVCLGYYNCVAKLQCGDYFLSTWISRILDTKLKFLTQAVWCIRLLTHWNWKMKNKGYVVTRTVQATQQAISEPKKAYFRSNGIMTCITAITEIRKIYSVIFCYNHDHAWKHAHFWVSIQVTVYRRPINRVWQTMCQNQWTSHATLVRFVYPIFTGFHLRLWQNPYLVI